VRAILIRVPTLVRITALCSTEADGSAVAVLEMAPLVDNLGVSWYRLGATAPPNPSYGDYDKGHTLTLASRENFAWNILAGTGFGSEAHKRLVSLELAAKAYGGPCEFQGWALEQRD
jgi:hypothetical protein